MHLVILKAYSAPRQSELQPRRRGEVGAFASQQQGRRDKQLLWQLAAAVAQSIAVSASEQRASKSGRETKKEVSIPFGFSSPSPPSSSWPTSTSTSSSRPSPPTSNPTRRQLKGKKNTPVATSPLISLDYSTSPHPNRPPFNTVAAAM